MKKLIAAIAMITMTGCTTMFQGSDQNVTISTLEDKHPNTTTCTLKNEEGMWKTRADMSVNIDRDGNDLVVSCKNYEQKGEVSIDPRFQAEWLVLDILWDACILTMSCVIDGATNAFYEYEENILVPMKSIVEEAQTLPAKEL